MKKLISIILAATLLIGTMAGCSSSETTPSEDNMEENSQGSTEASTEDKDSITIGIGAEAVTLDAHMTTASMSRQIYVNIYDPLVAKDENDEFVGRLADSWETSEDGMTITFKLKQGVKFHNGDELKASDVKFSYEKAMESSYVKFLYAAVDTVEAPDDYTVVLNLKNPAPYILEALSMPQAAIMCERAVTEAGEDYGRNPVGTGAYEFVEWVSGDSITLKAFEDHLRGPASITNLKFRFITDKSTGYIALEKGEIDVYYDTSPVDKERIQENTDLAYDETSSLYYEHIVFNNDNEYFKDVKVRQAIAYATDKESVIIAGKNGVATLANAHIPSTMFGYTEDGLNLYEYNPETARALLAEAGYADGFECTITVDASFREKQAQVLQANLAEVGITANIEVLEWGTFLSELDDGNFDIAFLGKNLHINDPALATTETYHTDYIEGGSNFYRYSNTELDALMDQSLVETDNEVRTQVVNDIVLLLNEELPSVPMYWSIFNIANNVNLNGVKAITSNHHEVYNFSW